MKTLAVLLSGVAIGALAVQGIHAQAKPPVYYISEIDISNPEAYGKEYAPKAQAVIKSLGGRFVAAGGISTIPLSSGAVTSFDGEAPKGRVTVTLWNDMDAVRAWRANPEYKKLRAEVGDKYAKFRSFAVEGVAQ
jgi:uncharacterized protein (DUF1330 family)